MNKKPVDTKKGTAQRRADLERRNAELQRENTELRCRLFAAHCYLRGFQLGFKEALRVSTHGEMAKTLAISLVRQADKAGKAHQAQPPSVMEALVPSFGADLFREVA